MSERVPRNGRLLTMLPVRKSKRRLTNQRLSQIWPSRRR